MLSLLFDANKEEDIIYLNRRSRESSFRTLSLI